MRAIRGFNWGAIYKGDNFRWFILPTLRRRRGVYYGLGLRPRYNMARTWAAPAISLRSIGIGLRGLAKDSAYATYKYK